MRRAPEVGPDQAVTPVQNSAQVGPDQAVMVGPAQVDIAIAAEPARAFGRYEAERPNQRWIGDVLVGPFVPHPRVAGSKRARLFLLVDDHSRLLVHGRWMAWENTRAGQDVLRAAIVRRGLPETLYVDNGAPTPMRRWTAAARCWASAWSTASLTGPRAGASRSG